VSDAVTALRVGRENPEDRAAHACARRRIEVRAKPINLGRAFVTIRTHAELAEDEWLVDRERRRRAVFDELAQGRGRTNEAVEVIARVVVHVAIVNVWQTVDGEPLAAFI